MLGCRFCFEAYTEVVPEVFYEKTVFNKLRSIHKKTLVLEFLFWPLGRQLY